MRYNSMRYKIYLNASAIFGLLVVLFAFGIDRTMAAEPRLALKGYDPVAYFAIGQPTKGNANFDRSTGLGWTSPKLTR